MSPVEQSANRACRSGISRPFRLLALALAGTSVISAVLVIPGWIPTLPRPIRRGLTEALLQTVLVVYSVLFLVALFGTVILGWLLARSFRVRKVRPRIARLFLACLSCLLALFLLELGSAAGAAGCIGFPRCRLDSPSVRPTNTGSSSWGVRVRRESRTGRGCRWARS